MAYFDIGGAGSPEDSIRTTSNTRLPKRTGGPGKKPTLTPAQKQKLQEMLKNGKLRPQNNTKYGVNTPQLPPQSPPGGAHTKYGINTPQLPPQLPPGGAHTKYGINTPKK